MLKGYTIIENVEKWFPPGSIHSYACLIIFRYIRCNIVILMAATVWLMLSFSSCIVCGFDLCTNARENITRTCAQRKAGYFFVAHSAHSGCLSVVLGYKHAIFMRHIVICGLSGSNIFFNIIS